MPRIAVIVLRQVLCVSVLALVVGRCFLFAGACGVLRQGVAAAGACRGGRLRLLCGGCVRRAALLHRCVCGGFFSGCLDGGAAAPGGSGLHVLPAGIGIPVGTGLRLLCLAVPGRKTERQDVPDVKLQEKCAEGGPPAITLEDVEDTQGDEPGDKAGEHADEQGRHHVAGIVASAAPRPRRGRSISSPS